MIHVCFVSDARFEGGAERYLADLAGNLDRARFRATLLVASGEGLDEWCARRRARGLTVDRVNMRFPRVPGDLLAARAAIRRIDPDLVHLNMPGPFDAQNATLAPIARALGPRVLTTEHLPMVRGSRKRSLVKRWAYRAVDRIVTVSEANRVHLERVQHVSPERIRVVHNGIARSFGTRPGPREDARRRFALDADRAVVTYVGNVLTHKGLDRVVRALAKVKNDDWQLAVAGSGPHEASCRALAETLGIAPRCHFLGRRSQDEVEVLLGASDMLVLPSEVEGLPYVILEAMACALPVVASPVAGIPEMVAPGRNGLLVDALDVDGLAEALAGLLGTPERRREMGREGRRRFEAHFTIEREIEEMESMYCELLKGTVTPREALP